MKKPSHLAAKLVPALMERAFAKQDVNAEGFLNNGVLLQEVTPEQVAAIDTDGDGRVSKAEYLGAPP